MKFITRHYFLITLAAVALIVYLQRARIVALFVPASPSASPTPGTTKTSTKSSPTQVLNRDLPLSKGSKGAEVKQLQTDLNNDGATLTVDGDFGSATEGALNQLRGVKLITLNTYENPYIFGAGRDPNAIDPNDPTTWGTGN